MDTRADVYALGAPLYELPVGPAPLRHETLCKAVLGETLRAVREDDPPMPSSRVSGSGREADHRRLPGDRDGTGRATPTPWAR